MKMYLDKLNSKPKLKKCLKIFGVIGICLSVIFNAIIITSALLLQSQSKSDNNVRNLATTPIKNVVQNEISANEIYRFYSINDLTSYDVMSNMYNYDRNNGNFFETNPYSFTFTPQSLNDIYIVDGGDTNHYDYTGFELKYRIKGATFSKTESPYRFVISMDFTICGLNATTTLGHFHVNNVRYKLGSGGLSSSTCSYFHDTNDLGLTLLLNSSFYLRCRQTSQTYNMFDFLGYGNLANDIEAYNVGYQSGYSSGYNEGYNEGYDNGSTGMTNNPFNLLLNGFLAIAGILNIHILPNLTLGVLIFAPLVVTIVIVIVKMIKG